MKKPWPTKRLGDVLLPTGQRDPSETPRREFTYVDIASVDNRLKAIVAPRQMRGSDAPSRARKVILADDVIVSTVRPNLNAVARVPRSLDNQICSTGFSVLRPGPGLLSGYLFAFTRSSSFIEYLVARTAGASYPAVSDDDVKSVVFPVPALDEQERILKLLDEAEELRKLRAEADARTTAIIPALFHEMFGMPSRPWSEVALRDGVSEFRYGTSVKSSTDGRPTLRIPNVLAQQVNLADVKFVRVSESEFERLRLADGDVLFVRTNGNPDYVGRSAVFDAKAVGHAGWDSSNFIYASYLIRARLRVQTIVPLFLQHFLATENGRKALRARAKTSAGQFNINIEGLGSLAIPVPPLDLQNKFAETVATLRRLQIGQASSREQLDEFFRSTLHATFSVRL